MENSIFEEHTAGTTSLGFDYQFYYFVYLLLDLKQGEKIGYEVKDDIHIEKSNGSIVLMQAKHTTQTTVDGDAKNITTLDVDMWKTLDIWATIIKDIPIDELENYSFILVTNKNNKGQNKIIEIVNSFQKKESTIEDVLKIFKTLIDKTNDKTIKAYIKNTKSIPNKKLQKFINMLSFTVGEDDIITKIKMRIKEKTLLADNVLINQIFNNLLSNIQVSKFLEIKRGRKYELSFDNFSSKFGICFRVAFQERPLPKRKFNIIPKDELKDLLFIKQLIDIGDIEANSTDIFDYASYMYQSLNQIQFWIDNNYVLPTEISDFEKNAILIWKNEFKSKYRIIQNKIKGGTKIDMLEDDIKIVALELVDFIRQEKLSLLNNDISLEESNGYFYVLSNEPKIGWHYNWSDKY